MIEEPVFQTEKELEDATAEMIQAIMGDSASVLRGFGLDLAIFGINRTCFLEIKAFAEHHGRCGFGNQRGEGNQIRLLYDEGNRRPRTKSQLEVFDPSIRWLLGNRSRPVGSPRFLFFGCQQAQNAAMGAVRPGKQNNLRLSVFDRLWITWPELLRQVKDFISRK